MRIQKVRNVRHTQSETGHVSVLGSLSFFLAILAALRMQFRTHTCKWQYDSNACYATVNSIFCKKYTFAFRKCKILEFDFKIHNVGKIWTRAGKWNAIWIFNWKIELHLKLDVIHQAKHTNSRHIYIQMHFNQQYQRQSLLLSSCCLLLMTWTFSAHIIRIGENSAVACLCIVIVF